LQQSVSLARKLKKVRRADATSHPGDAVPTIQELRTAPPLLCRDKQSRGSGSIALVVAAYVEAWDILGYTTYL